ncbi:MAG TPA: DUF6549 family protein [Paludibacter sp.]
MVETLYRSISIGLFILLVMASVALFVTKAKNERLTADNARFTKNIEVLNKNFVSYKTAYGHSAAKVEALTYTKKEASTYAKRPIEQAKELNIKPKDIVSTTEIGMQTDTHVTATIQPVDSCFTYKDSFNTVYGCIHPKFVTLDIHTRDSLTTFVNRIPKHHFLWWSWGTKAIELNIIAQNPKTTFNYLRYIELKK